MPDGLRPVKPAVYGIRLQGGSARCKRPYGAEFTSKPFSKFSGAVISGALQIKAPVKFHKALIIYGETLLGRYLLQRRKRSTGGGICLPDAVETIQNLRERLLELKAAAVSDNPLEVKRSQHKTVLPALVQGV